MRARIAIAVALLAAPAGPALCAATTASDLDHAFATAFGAPAPLTRHVVRPVLSGYITSREPQAVTLVLRPASLIALGHERYALLAVENEALAAHAEPGAVSIAYLTRRPSGWDVERTWPEFAWVGNDGHASDGVSQQRVRGRRLVFIANNYVGQGERTITDVVIQLGPDAPRFLGRIPAAGRLEEGCCRRWIYSSRIGPPQRDGDLVSVRYVGWTAASGDARRTRFATRTDFAVTSAGLAPTSAVHLPFVD